MSTPAAEAYSKAQQKMAYPAPVTYNLGTPTLDHADHADRCDRCGAQAWVRTESAYSTLQLTWCAHHYTEVEQHFSPATHVITDERPYLHAVVKAQASRKEVH